MRSFCIVVQRGHEDLYEALREAFRRRAGFHVVIDRRTRRVQGRSRGRRDRRGVDEDWGNAHFIIAECVEPFGGTTG